MAGRLTNKVAVITGSSSGIGRAIALAFASEGAKIVCSDIREDFRSEYRTDELSGTTVQEVKKVGVEAIYQKCDTTQSSEVETLINKAVEAFGRVDIMVNNAGIAIETTEHGPRPVWDFDESAFEKTMQVNIKGVFLGTKFATRQMKDQKPHPSGDRGWIINLASVYGLVGGTATCAYITSKHAVMGLTKSTASDCAPYRIHVNALCPGYVQTSFISGFLLSAEAEDMRKDVIAKHPFRGLGTPQDIARAAVFLASEDAGWVTGIGLPVDGGYSSI
ncbi:short-chain dehydrogenase/reductase-like protein [Ophiobolus disseminans]|uniref:Short-chain dehydrogenase/reductase-like protein n=1 Tax=Ophiobolus disseminans TaxID=1469910 RepID=A0A6A6ZJB8_9PLEO|nr:short-chain dehydrogenase/reductase-like protein [Ophiobolus disseminans]